MNKDKVMGGLLISDFGTAADEKSYKV